MAEHNLSFQWEGLARRCLRLYGDRLSFMGGIDVRELYSNDLKRVEAELQKKIPIVMPGYGFCLHSDHSIPATVDFDVYKYFVDRGREIGTYI